MGVQAGSNMGGFRELAALTTNGVNGVGTSEAMVPPGQLRTLGKRRRTGPGQLQLRAPCADSLEGIRSAYEVGSSSRLRSRCHGCPPAVVEGKFCVSPSVLFPVEIAF